MCCGAFCRLCTVAGMPICSLLRESHLISPMPAEGSRMILPMQVGRFGRLLGRGVGCEFL